MTLTIELPPATERWLLERAAAAGRPAAEVATELLNQLRDPRPPLFEVMAPFAVEFAASGMTEEEFDVLIDQARQEVWEEWKAKGKA